jgi:hypothetical protein
MRNIASVAIGLGVCKLGFSTAIVAFGKYRLGLGPGELQTLAFVTLVFGAQAVLYAVRERRQLWSSRPRHWVLLASAADIAIVSVLALSGILMAPLPWRVVAVARRRGRAGGHRRIRATARSDQAAGDGGVRGSIGTPAFTTTLRKGSPLISAASRSMSSRGVRCNSARPSGWGSGKR